MQLSQLSCINLCETNHHLKNNWSIALPKKGRESIYLPSTSVENICYDLKMSHHFSLASIFTTKLNVYFEIKRINCFSAISLYFRLSVGA